MLQRRQREAQAFMETVNRSKLGLDWREKTAANEPGQLAQRHVGEGMVIDPSLIVATQRFSGLGPAWFAACTATLDVGLRRFALLAGTNHIMRVRPCLAAAALCRCEEHVSRAVACPAGCTGGWHCLHCRATLLLQAGLLLRGGRRYGWIRGGWRRHMVRSVSENFGGACLWR